MSNNQINSITEKNSKKAINSEHHVISLQINIWNHHQFLFKLNVEKSFFSLNNHNSTDANVCLPNSLNNPTMLETKIPETLEMPMGRKRGLSGNFNENNVTQRLRKKEVLPPITLDQNKNVWILIQYFNSFLNLYWIIHFVGSFGNDEKNSKSSGYDYCFNNHFYTYYCSWLCSWI